MGFNSSFSFLGIGIPELMLILVLALVVLGPERLPGVAKDLIRTFFRVRNLSRDLTGQLEKELGVEELKELRGLKTGGLVEAWANDELDINLDRDDAPAQKSGKEPAAPSASSQAKPASSPAAVPQKASRETASPQKHKVASSDVINAGMAVGTRPSAAPAPADAADGESRPAAAEQSSPADSEVGENSMAADVPEPEPTASAKAS